MDNRAHIRNSDVSMVVRLCETAGMPDFLVRLNKAFQTEGILDAVKTSNTATLYEWLMLIFNFQGVSDAVARRYIATHGSVRFSDLEKMFSRGGGLCSKLDNFAVYKKCRFRKIKQTCSNPSELSHCPVGRLPLRNGQLNQTAFALYLFLRDICHGDLVGFIDRHLAQANWIEDLEQLLLMRNILVADLRMIYGVSNKVINMAFADLLLAGDPARPVWRNVGASMTAIDTLLHNFLHRTGLIQRYGKMHSYGTSCYRDEGCAYVIELFARLIDARRFDPSFPSYFPRFVQHALWRHCASGEMDVCNGRRIDGRARCQNKGCAVYNQCGRHPLSPI